MDEASRQRAEEMLGHTFGDASLLETALTHPSYAAEHSDAGTYDRLEFLGDSVLGFIVSDVLYRALPEAPEGELTRRKHHAVSGEALAEAAEALGIGELLQLGRGALAAGDRQRSSVLENTIEALIGALYLDGGLECAERFTRQALADRLAVSDLPVADPKSALQQITQARLAGLPRYRIVSHEGPPHRRTFTAEVMLGETVVGRGTGHSKQSAEKAAAADALGSFTRTRDDAGTAL